MKIRYKHQRFQAEAAKCVSDVFQGQPKHDGSRTFLNKFGALNFDGFGNFPLVLDNESICENVRGIQMAEGLNPVEHLEGDGRTFTIEMETGTGKTYTYIKTMYELNARYGWSKFVIVVCLVLPSAKACSRVLRVWQSTLLENMVSVCNTSSTTRSSSLRLMPLLRITAFMQ